MKVVFAGPSCPDASLLVTGIDIRPPAIQGDIYKAVRDGATAIGLIDGNFEYVSPVWHKEILHAMAAGVTVLGAASMGALRAAECAAYGMIGVGRIYAMYAAGELVDDADVCQVHAPRELGYRALSEPLVNVIATLEEMAGHGAVTGDERRQLDESARAIFYKQRTWKTIMAASGLPEERQRVLLRELPGHAVDLKRLDALKLLDELVALPSVLDSKPQDWVFQSTSLWQALESGEALRRGS